jgi:hypothetical protein
MIIYNAGGIEDSEKGLEEEEEEEEHNSVAL